MGSKNASGTCEDAVDLAVSEGGDGVAVYSVSDKPLSFGVRGVWTPLDIESSAMITLNVMFQDLTITEFCGRAAFLGLDRASQGFLGITLRLFPRNLDPCRKKLGLAMHLTPALVHTKPVLQMTVIKLFYTDSTC